MSEIKLSIIVPVYNTEKYLRQCLDSLLTQTLQELEIICVNDGSTDSSPAILEEYASKDSRIRILTKENDGLGAARNSGILVATGEYIGFVDSDDFIDKNMFQILYDKAQKNDCEVVIGNIYLYFDDSGLTKPYRSQKLLLLLEQQETFCARQFPVIVESIGVWDRIYKREFLQKHNLRNPEHVIYEDALFSFQTSVLANRISVCHDALYMYRKNTGTAITDKEIWNNSYKLDFLKNSTAIKKFLHEQELYPIFRINYMHYFLMNALWHQSNIAEWNIFKLFFKQTQNIAEKSALRTVFKDAELSWKVKLYALLLMRDMPFLCYSIFFYKRIKRKRSQKHG